MAAQFGQVIEGQGINERQRAFLLACTREMTVAAAARTSGITRRDHYRWLGEPGYRIVFDEARESAAQFFEAEVLQRCEQWRAEQELKWRLRHSG